MSTLTKTLYDTDFHEWAVHTAELLRERRFAEVDLESLVEEVEALANANKKAVWSQLRRLVMHLLKAKIQPQRFGRSWATSVVDAQAKLKYDFKVSPSLRRYAKGELEEIYETAINDAIRETMLTTRAKDLPLPQHCPYTLEDLLDSDLDALLNRLS